MTAGDKKKEIYIVGAARTPIGSFRSSLATVPATQLGAIAIKEALNRAGVPANAVQEVVMGQVLQANVGQSPARQAALGAGCDVSTVVTTVNKVCSSGMKAVILAAQQIETGNQDVVIGGGMENMSQVPFYLPRAEPAYGGAALADGIIKDGFTDAYDQVHMGICGEKVRADRGITREEQDAYAIQSYQRAAEAWKAGAIGPEIVPVPVKTRDGEKIVDTDEDFTKVYYAKLLKLKPSFKEDGTITPANTAALNDGGAAVVLVSEDAIKEHNAKPLARVLSYADAAVHPLDFCLAPIHVVPKLLKSAGLTLADIDHFECNEPFAIVPLAFQKELGVDWEKLNPQGGAVALGHPIGMTGARLIAHLVYTLKAGQRGIAITCNGGGGASGMIIEKM